MSPAELAEALSRAVRSESWRNFVLDEGHGVAEAGHGPLMPHFVMTTQDGAEYQVSVHMTRDPLMLRNSPEEVPGG